MYTETDLASIIGKAIDYIVENQEPEGHYGDVRSTALVCWAFAEAVESPHDSVNAFQSISRRARKWLVEQRKDEDGGISWESEVWDTAQVMLALLTDFKFHGHVSGAAAWLQKIRDVDNGYGVWYEEIWETTLASVALIRAVAHGWISGTEAWLNEVLGWFNSIPSRDDGYFIAPHYCGFLAWILGELQKQTKIRYERIPHFTEFERKAGHAVRWLLDRIEKNADLWSSYTFSNSYAIYGLSILHPDGFPKSVYIEKIANWFERAQLFNGSYEDIEDTSLSILALTSFINLSVGCDQRVQLISQKVSSIRAPLHCFVGYSKKSTSLFMQLNEHLQARFGDLLVIDDWKDKSRQGHHLFDEIKKANEYCQMAIFLITKDDNVILENGSVVASPRDNVIFEVGFFAARHGLERTLLVVEDGAKKPSDWDGILHLSLTDYPGIDKAIESILFE